MKTLQVVKRAGSYGWLGRDEPKTKESKTALEEDFQHLFEQTNLLWETRDKMQAIRERNSEARWTSLTNAFTYLYIPSIQTVV
jgi:phosphatidylserine/phosphatidylglycerophosphate/cardiolipin synthase-like enzyme